MNVPSLLGQWINIYHWKTNLDMPYCILMNIIIQINKRGSWLSMETTAELGNTDIFQIKHNISDTLWNGEFFYYWAVTGYNGTKTLVEQSDRKILRAIFRFCVKARKNVAFAATKSTSTWTSMKNIKNLISQVMRKNKCAAGAAI